MDRTDLPQETSDLPTRYVLTHTHNQGATPNLFDYAPSAEAPYPDPRKVALALFLEYDETEDELELTPITDEFVDESLTADQVGTTELETFIGPVQKR